MVDITRHEKYMQGIVRNIPIHIVGCGSIGTIVATTLARMGMEKFVLYDPDIIEEHNIANQYFEKEDLGKLKVTALTDKILGIEEKAEVTINTRKYGEDDKDGEEYITIVCIDNMEGRKEIYNKKKGAIGILIDGRMGGQNGQVHCLRTENREACKNYEQSLYSDGQSETLACTERTIIYTVITVAALMSKRTIELLGQDKTKYEQSIIVMKNNPTIEKVIHIQE